MWALSDIEEWTAKGFPFSDPKHAKHVRKKIGAEAFNALLRPVTDCEGEATEDMPEVKQILEEMESLLNVAAARCPDVAFERLRDRTLKLKRELGIARNANK